MPGVALLDLLVGRVENVSSGVARHNAGYSLNSLKLGFDAPEAASCEDGSRLFTLHAIIIN